jgi:hypothetical protein
LDHRLLAHLPQSGSTCPTSWLPTNPAGCSGAVTFTASFTLPDGTPLVGEMAPWTGSNAPTVHIVGHLLSEEHAGMRLRM